MMQQSSAIAIFCCYARQDKDLLDKLKSHLSPLQKQNGINVWHDGDISAGTEWEQEIKKYLNDAKIILLLISSDFINSDYCYSTEMQHALERHKQREGRVIPVIVRPTTGWENISPRDIKLGDLQALPTDAKAVTTWRNRDSAWGDVVRGIEQAIKELTTQQPPTTPTVPPALPLELASRVSERDMPPFEAGEGEKTTIVSSHSLAQTPNTLRLLRWGTEDRPLVLESHDRLITIGRAPKNMVSIQDDTVSWEHGQIILKEGEYHYCHMSGSNFTLLRRKDQEELFRPGEKKELRLRNQDRLRIGKTTFIVECDLINEDTGKRTTGKSPDNA